MKKTLMLTWLFVYAGQPTAQAQSWPGLSNSATVTDYNARRDSALIIAVEDYAFLPDIPGAVDIAHEWEAWFLESGMSRDNLIVLENSGAVDHQIEDSAQQLSAGMSSQGRLWFLFIGHGAPSETGTDTLLVGADAGRSVGGLRARSVSRDELRELMGSGPQRDTVAIIDACFSGQGTNGEALVPDLQFAVPDYSAQPVADMTMLTATSPGEYAGQLPGGDVPAFSYLVLGALRGWADNNQDGQVTASEAIDYTSSALQITVRDRTQSPVMTGDDVTLSSGSEVGPNLAMVLVGPSTEATPNALSRDQLAARAWSQLEPQLSGWDSDKLTKEVMNYLARYGDGVEDHLTPDVVKAARAELKQWSRRQRSSHKVLREYEMERIEGSTFSMGAPPESREVTISRPYMIGTVEATQDLYETLYNHNPMKTREERFGGISVPCNRTGVSPDRPMVCLTYSEVALLANHASVLLGYDPCYVISDNGDVEWPRGPACEGWRLPTEAEWEYAARAGSQTAYSGRPVGIL